MLEPHADIAQFPRLHWRVFAHIARLEPQGTVHQPVFVIRRTVGAADNLRPVFVIGTFHVFPGFFGFEYMRIGIDFNHGQNPPDGGFVIVPVITPRKAPRQFSLESAGLCDNYQSL